MRGLDQMVLDMYGNPGLLHRLMSFLRDDYMSEIDLFEEANEVSLNNKPDNVAGSGGQSPTTDLPDGDLAGPVGVRHCLCCGESQESMGVGPMQRLEFVLQHQLPLLHRFGLVDYGCCEPHDKKLDLLIRRIPHLRWVSVAPWSDRQSASEKLGCRYVYIYKPNPTRLCSPQPYWEAVELELRETLSIARDCAVHLMMKDTHTYCHEPQRITLWTERTSRVVEEMAP